MSEHHRHVLEIARTPHRAMGIGIHPDAGSGVFAMILLAISRSFNTSNNGQKVVLCFRYFFLLRVRMTEHTTTLSKEAGKKNLGGSIRPGPNHACFFLVRDLPTVPINR